MSNNVDIFCIIALFFPDRDKAQTHNEWEASPTTSKPKKKINQNTFYYYLILYLNSLNRYNHEWLKTESTEQEYQAKYIYIEDQVRRVNFDY